MAKHPPSFDLYVTDFRDGVRRLPLSAIGAYILLLVEQFECGELPSDIKELAAICHHEPIESFEQIWECLHHKFDENERGCLENEKMTAIRLKTWSRWESSVKNGKLGGRPRKTSQESNRLTKTETHRKPDKKGEGGSKKGEARREKSEDWILPEGWDRPEVREALDAWAAMRFAMNKRIRSKATTSRIFKKFDSPEHLIYAADLCTANNYQGIKPDYRPPKSETTAIQQSFSERL